jgi:hypothetical protein
MKETAIHRKGEIMHKTIQNTEYVTMEKSTKQKHERKNNIKNLSRVIRN